ncbi:hypothetical protein TNCV_1402631 [Trichonephila clavipes]|nr:hypothetical protein TNCV_1402631 [Trichonephila clavipes]
MSHCRKYGAPFVKPTSKALQACFPDVSGMKPCSYLPPNQQTLIIFFQTETTLISNQKVTPLMACPVSAFLMQL